MISGAPQEAGWQRPAPRRVLAAETLDRILQAAFPRRSALRVEPLSAGWRNANFRIELDGSSGSVVLRIYEHDPSLCQKEIDILRLLSGSVPVPELLYAAPRGIEDVPPFTVARFIDAVSFHELKRAGDREAIAQAAYSAGETLAAIGSVRFAKAGWLGPGPAVGAPLLPGSDPVPRFVDLCLEEARLQSRVTGEWRVRVHELIWNGAPELSALDNDPRLVHGDFNRRNLLVWPVGGRWKVAAVLDWEFAVSSSPLADLGSFLRYETGAAPVAEPHFSEGYRAGGGTLPENWRRLSRLLALAAICESLTHEDLPEAVIQELVTLLQTHAAIGGARGWK